MSEPFNTAFKLLTLNCSVIPSGGGDKGKAPLVSWREWQDHAPDENQLVIWERELNPPLWGIVTGETIGVIDADTPEARAQLTAELGEPNVITPRGGAHWYVDTTGHPLKTKAGVLPDIDVRGVGGFVNIAGGKYEIVNLPVPGELIKVDDLPEYLLLAANGSKPTTPNPAPTDGGIPEGQRNHALTSLAGTMQRRGMSKESIAAALLEENATRCQPPLAESEVRAIAESVSRYPPTDNVSDMYKYNTPVSHVPTRERDKNVTDSVTTTVSRITEWVKSTTGWWDTTELDRELDIYGDRDRANRRQILIRLKNQGILEAHPKFNKQWRFVDQSIVSLNFKTATRAGVLPIIWPLGIEKYVNLFPGNLAVIAGSPNAGKTALMLNFIYLNQDAFPIYYFCSEMGAVELRDRLDKFPGMDIEDWHFESFERASEFADVIRPDCINIVDYLEMTTDLFDVNKYLTAINHKVGSGLALVAIQKKKDAKYGRGQEFSLEKPKLYLSLDQQKMMIVKGKSWAKKNVNPNDLEVGFKIVGGCQFEASGEWRWKG